MRRFQIYCILFILAISTGSAWASFFETELGIQIDDNDPDGGIIRQEYGPDPVQVSVSTDTGVGDSYTGWWNVGGNVQNTWDDSYSGVSYFYGSLEREFKVTAAGPATIDISLNGALQVTADPKYDRKYYLYSNAELSDSTSANAGVTWYDELETSGTLDLSYGTTFNYDFTDGDIESIFSVDLYLDTNCSKGSNGIPIADDDLLEFVLSFDKGLSIDGITGGIEAADGPPAPAPAPVPVPPSLWLFGSAIVGMIGLRRKQKA